jgi:hypothetical protein
MLSHVLEISYFPFINAGKWVLLDIVEGCVREGGSLNNITDRRFSSDCVNTSLFKISFHKNISMYNLSCGTVALYGPFFFFFFLALRFSSLYNLYMTKQGQIEGSEVITYFGHLGSLVFHCRNTTM